MIDDRDVWQAAVLIVKRYCDDVMQVLEEGDMAGAETWRPILNAIESGRLSHLLHDGGKGGPLRFENTPADR
jgi:hypothetical protein